MRSIADLFSARAATHAFLGDGFGILEAAVIVIVVSTGAFLCLIAYDLNTKFKRFDKLDARRRARDSEGAGIRARRARRS